MDFLQQGSSIPGKTAEIEAPTLLFSGKMRLSAPLGARGEQGSSSSLAHELAQDIHLQSLIVPFGTEAFDGGGIDPAHHLE